MGPTAAGKTELAVQLVDEFPVEIISVDSALVYRGMNIGTAKPEAEILARAPHHLIDIREPNQTYSVAEFREDALAAMREITAAGRIPLLVGGTMLYFKALERGLADLPKANHEIRSRLESEWRRRGLKHLHQRLHLLDPRAAQRIHEHDPQRILRALEVIELSGRPISELQQMGTRELLPYRVLKLVRAPRDRKILHRRIEQRYHRMLADGFEEEVRRLYRSPGFSPKLPSMRAVGYRQMIRYLTGEISRDEMIRSGIIATRQLAKRQYTWLKADPEGIWLDEETHNLLEDYKKIITLHLAQSDRDPQHTHAAEG
jgi:tRNA dimethylallyltransferase